MLTVVIMKNKQSRSIILHYQRVLDLLNDRLRDIDSIFEISVPDREPWPYDAGIIFIDIDKRKITSFQTGFGMHNINEKSRKYLIKKYKILWI